MRHGVPLSYKTVASCSDLKNLHSFVTLSDALSFFRSMLAVFFKYDCSLLRVRNQCYEHGNEPLSSAETNFLTCWATVSCLRTSIRELKEQDGSRLLFAAQTYAFLAATFMHNITFHKYLESRFIHFYSLSLYIVRCQVILLARFSITMQMRCHAQSCVQLSSSVAVWHMKTGLLAYVEWVLGYLTSCT